MSERGSADEKSWTGCSRSYNFEYFTKKCQMPVERDCREGVSVHTGGIGADWKDGKRRIYSRLSGTGETGSTWISYQGTDQSGGFAEWKKCVLSICEKVFKCDWMQLCDRGVFYGIGSAVSKHNRAG